MEHIGILNNKCLPNDNYTECYSQLKITFESFFSLNTNKDRFKLFFDSSENLNFRQCKISLEKTMDDFLLDLHKNNDIDLSLAIQEMEDKSPALDNLSDNDIAQITSSIFYFPNLGVENNIDFLSIAWHLNGILLSPSIEQMWQPEYIEIARFEENRYEKDWVKIRNISNINSAKAIKKKILYSSKTRLKDVLISQNFTQEIDTWYESLDSISKERVISKLEMAVEKNFRGGKPLFKQLTNADGIIELRISSGSGGTIRILFYQIKEITYILNGFIKKSDNDGYDSNIGEAKTLINTYIDNINKEKEAQIYFEKK